MSKRLRLIASSLAALTAVALLAGCDSSGGGGGFKEQTQGGQGQESSVQVGGGAKLPADFPSAAVPLPDAHLQAVVTGRNRSNRTYTLAYGLGGRDGVAAGVEYKDQLDKAGFTIKNFSSTSGSDGGFTTFEATSKDWDVSVVSGKATRLEPQAMSVQVVTHGALSDLDELGVLGSSSTTSTSSPTGP